MKQIDNLDLLQKVIHETFCTVYSPLIDWQERLCVFINEYTEDVELHSLSSNVFVNEKKLNETSLIARINLNDLLNKELTVKYNYMGNLTAIEINTITFEFFDSTIDSVIDVKDLFKDYVKKLKLRY